MAPNDTDTKVERVLPVHALDSPLAIFKLSSVAEQLRDEAAWRAGGRNAMTLVKDQALRVVLVAMRAGTVVPEHHAEGPVLLHVTAGCLRVTGAQGPATLRSGELLALGPGIRHAVEAIEETTFLLVLATETLHPAEPA